MADTPASHEDRIDAIAAQVRELRARVDELAGQVQKMSLQQSPVTEGHLVDDVSPSMPMTVTVTGHLNAPRMLSSVALVCFLLVVALILRTIADNKIVNPELGAALGLGYAVLLIAYGHFRGVEASRRALVVVICGAFLLFAVVLETHSRFRLLPTAFAYLLLGMTLVALTRFGSRSGLPSALWVGVLGASLSGLAVDFPHPHFGYLAILLVLANVVSYSAIRTPKCRALIWLMLAITLFFWLLWTVQVRAEFIRLTLPNLTRYESALRDVSALRLRWFLPSLTVFTVMYAVITIWSATRKGWHNACLEALLPIVNAPWIYGVVKVATIPWKGREQTIGTILVVVALIHLIAAMWLAKWGRKHTPAIAGYTLASVSLLALSLNLWVNEPLATLLILCVAAIGVWDFSTNCRNHDVRVVSYLLQIYTSIAAVLFGSLATSVPIPVAKVVVATLLASLCVIHFAGCRRRPPRDAAGLFALIDSGDRMAILVLFAGLLYAFGAARMALYAAIAPHVEDVEGAFQCGQSALINLCVIVTVMLGVMWRDRELLVVAATLAVIGAFKVFGYDLMHIHGIPQVLSVFTFGVMAALGSLAWGKWQRQMASSRVLPREDEEKNANQTNNS